MEKSELVSVWEVLGVEELTNVLECKVGFLPIAYLGLPLGSSLKVCAMLNSILVDGILAGWKKLYLLLGGGDYFVEKHLIYFIYLFLLVTFSYAHPCGK